MVLPYSESYFEETKYILVKFYQLSCIFENTIKGIEFENTYESSIIFQPFLYANVPAESPSYTLTFFVQIKKYLILKKETQCHNY